jgi:NADPH-dependent 2,4-dienoyl-CoA reductase/sulfur reductase-like enzyme
MLTQSVLPVLPPKTIYYDLLKIMSEGNNAQKTIVIGAGPVGALAALYAAQRGHDVEVYELRSGTFSCLLICL